MIEENTEKSERSRSRVAFAAAAVALVVIAAAIYFPPGRRRNPGGSASRATLPFDPAERAYAPKLNFGDFSIRRAENYLHQEVTTFSIAVTNTGDRPLRAIEITLELHDEMNQVVLRETRRILSPSSPPLAAGQKRAFDVSFEHLPDLWNRQAPNIRVTGLRFD